MDGPFHQIIMENTKQIEDASDLNDHLESLTKVPTPNVLESQADHSTRTKSTEHFECKEFGHMQKDCLELNKPHKEDHPGPKKFEDYTYTYSGPEVQPQMQINPANSNMATTYDQALGVIKDSINTANPLASLNL